MRSCDHTCCKGVLPAENISRELAVPVWVQMLGLVVALVGVVGAVLVLA